MGNRKTIEAVFIVSWLTGVCWASGCTQGAETPRQEISPTDPTDAVLERLNKTTSQLTSYEAQIEYKYKQPLLESESLNKGVLYYTRSGGTAALRVNFSTRKQDNEPEQNYIEDYIVLDGSRLSGPGRQLKGIWLVQLDYQLREAKYYQLAEPNDPNAPADLFELAGRNLPMLGFTKIEDLKREFDAGLVKPESDTPKDFIQVHLKVKPNSVYKDDFVSMDFWIDEKLGLPVKVVAVKTEPEPPFGDIQEIKFLKPKVNKDIDGKVFEFKIPNGFGEPEIVPLQKDKTRK
jgi:hypothetical protein